MITDDNANAPDAIDELEAAQDKAKPDGAATIAARLAERELQLAHDADGVAWAKLPSRLGDYAAPAQGREIRRFVQSAYWCETQKPINREPLTAALDLLEARALHESPLVDVRVRLASVEDVTYLDLARPKDSRAVQITANGWKVVEAPQVWFARPSGILPLPVPERGGSLAELRQFHPALKDNSIWALVASWLVSVWRPCGGYAVLSIRGEAGSGKSTLARVLVSLVDPRKADLRRPPTKDRDLIAAARAAHVLAFDNVSWIPDWLADDLCRIATGAALATRELFTTADEFVVQARRPLLLTSIPDVVSNREDLRDRAAVVFLPPMSDGAREEDATLDQRLERARPRLVGAMLDAVVVGMRRLEEVQLSQGVRMLDHLRWAVACAPGLGLSEKENIDAHVTDRTSGAAASIEGSPIGRALSKVTANGPWVGPAEELLKKLNSTADGMEARRNRTWPQSPRALRSVLDRLAPSLRRLGWEVELPDGKSHRNRLIRLRAPVGLNSV